MIGLKPGMPLPDDLLGGGTHLWSLLLQEVNVIGSIVYSLISWLLSAILLRDD